MDINNNVNIDTLNISFDIEQVVKYKRYKENKILSASDFVLGFLNRLSFVEETTSADGWKSWRGRLRNYSVEITGNKITLFGSLCKFFHGNNLKALTLEEMNLALKLLTRESGLPILHGRIIRIDLGINLKVDEAPKNYFNLFEETPKWIRNVQRSGIRYEKTTQIFSMYDKKIELQRRSPDVHHLVRNENILRAECRFKKGLKQMFNHSHSVKVVYLMSSSFRNNLALIFMKNYFSLCTKVEYSFLDVEDVSDIKNLLYFRGIESLGGRKSFMEIINKIRKEKNWPYNKTASIRQWTSRVMKNTTGIYQIDGIEELNKKITSAISNSDLFKFEEMPIPSSVSDSNFKPAKFTSLT